jgi:3-phenylpropionate/cinnamic acid dioxygenase small subunit
MDPLNHTSLAYEDRLLLRLRIARLREGPFSQHPLSRSQHVLQMPEIEAMRDGLHVTRTAFLYVEVRGDEQQVHAGTAFHHLRDTPEGLRIVLKRVNLLGCEQALPSLQLFP